MTSSTLEFAPGATARGAFSNAATLSHGNVMLSDLLTRAGHGYQSWLDHISAASGCTRPVRLSGNFYDFTKTGDRATLDGVGSTGTMPDGVVYKACGNRRESLCPACAKVYQQDAYQVVRSGIVGGKGIPETVASHVSVFATFTAPSFGAVHARRVPKHTCTNRRRCDCRSDPCRPWGDKLCKHGKPQSCQARHENGDAERGKPICLDCYDHIHHVVWNRFAGQLWRRTLQAIGRELGKIAKARGVARVVVGEDAKGRAITVAPVRVSCGKAAEFQLRGAVHFHALIRLDGIDGDNPDAIIPAPACLTADDLDTAIRKAVSSISFRTPPHQDKPEGWLIGWGDPDKGLDIRPVTLSGNGEVTDSMVAGYLAKYAVKSTEVTGHRSTQITDENILAWGCAGGTHTERLIAACWWIGRPTPQKRAPGSKLGPRKVPGIGSVWKCSTCGKKTALDYCEGCRPGNPPLWPADTGSDVQADNDRPDVQLRPRWLGELSVTKEAAPFPAPNDPSDLYPGLRRWAHMLGFGGHFLTKSRRYSVTFKVLRDTRVVFRRAAEAPPSTVDPAEVDEEATVLVISTLRFAGVGWQTSADAMLANTSAAMAREHRQMVRAENAHRDDTPHTSSQT